MARDHATFRKIIHLVRPDAPALGGDDDVCELLGGEESREEAEEVALVVVPLEAVGLVLHRDGSAARRGHLSDLKEKRQVNARHDEISFKTLLS